MKVLKVILVALLTVGFWGIWGTAGITGHIHVFIFGAFLYVLLSVAHYRFIRTVNYFLVASLPGFWLSMVTFYSFINAKDEDRSTAGLVLCTQFLIFTLIPAGLAFFKHRELLFLEKIDDLEFKIQTEESRDKEGKSED